jgi:hypothetical protein
VNSVGLKARLSEFLDTLEALAYATLERSLEHVGIVNSICHSLPALGVNAICSSQQPSQF